MKKQPSRRSVFLWASFTATIVLLLALTHSRPLFRSATSFGFRNANKVRHLTFAQGKQQVQLSKRGNRWHINGGDEAQQDKVADALYALQMLEVKYPLTAEQQQQYSSVLFGSGLRVKVSGWLGSLRSYSLYSCDSLLVGTVRKGKPYYVLEVRGNEGLNLFSLLGANIEDWNKTLIINVLQSNVTVVTVEDLGNPQRSFTLSVDTLKNAQVEALYSGEQFTDLNKEKVKRYLSYFSSVSVERYATELSKEKVEEVILSDAAYIITLTNRAGEVQVIKLFYIPLNDELDAFGRPTKVDLNRCYLQLDDEPSLAIALWTDFDLLIKEPQFFTR